jgi:hypothetical protein
MAVMIGLLVHVRAPRLSYCVEPLSAPLRAGQNGTTGHDMVERERTAPGERVANTQLHHLPSFTNATFRLTLTPRVLRRTRSPPAPHGISHKRRSRLLQGGALYKGKTLNEEDQDNGSPLLRQVKPS